MENVEDKAKRVFEKISKLEKGDISDKSLAFDVIGILGNELTKESYESRLEIVDKMIEKHLESKK